MEASPGIVPIRDDPREPPGAASEKREDIDVRATEARDAFP
jgi:hypothetical protein